MIKQSYRIIVVMLSIFLFLTACNNEPEQLYDATEEETEQAAEVIMDYKEGLVDSINKGTFNFVEPYLIKNTSLYHSIRRYVDEMVKQRAQKEIELIEIEKVQIDELGEYYVDVHEKVILKTSNGEKPIERYVQFHLDNYKGELRIVNIKVNSTDE